MQFLTISPCIPNDSAFSAFASFCLSRFLRLRTAHAVDRLASTLAVCSRTRSERLRSGEGKSRLQSLLSRQVEVLEDRSLLAAGALDPMFGVGGIVITNVTQETA